MLIINICLYSDRYWYYFCYHDWNNSKSQELSKFQPRTLQWYSIFLIYFMYKLLCYLEVVCQVCYHEAHCCQMPLLVLIFMTRFSSGKRQFHHHCMANVYFLSFLQKLLKVAQSFWTLLNLPYQKACLKILVLTVNCRRF